MTRVRLIAVGLHLDPGLVVDASRLRRHLDQALDGHLPDDGCPTLVALPEHTGLLAMLTGERGEDARRALADGADSRTALMALAVAYGDELGDVASRFPDVTAPARLLHLALTDTVVRTLTRTVGALARDRGCWATVGAALPAWDDVPVASGAHGPSHPPTGVRHVPRTSWVRNRNLVFGPDGLVDVQDKAYLVPMERDPDGLALASVAVDGLRVVDLPIGRLGTVTSKDAWMVDVNDRLDQLGVRLLVQPEAFDRWDEVDHGAAGAALVDDLWPPDKFQRGGWWMVQRHPSVVATAAPVLVGGLGDLRFDGQASVAVTAPAGDRSLGLLGQPADEGWGAVGHWWREPSVPPTALADPGRRRPARRRGHAAPTPAVLAAVAEVEVPGGSARRSGADVGDVEAPPSRALPGDGSHLVPQLALAGEQVVLVAVEGDGGTRQRLRTWVENDHGDLSVGAELDPPRAGEAPPFDRRWRPRLVDAGGGRVVDVHLAFTHESWDLYAVPLHDPNARVRVDDADDADGVLRERGHDAHVVVRHHDELLVAWSDLRWPFVFPQVRVASSVDGGRTWTRSRRVDGTPTTGAPIAHDPRTGRHPDESYGQTAPSLTVAADTMLVAWQERVPGVGPATRLARRRVDGSWEPVPEASGAGAPAPLARYRPLLIAAAGRVHLVEEVTARDGGRGLTVRTLDGAGVVGPARSADPTRPAGAVQTRAEAVAVGDRTLLVAQDDRTGRSQVLVHRLGTDGRPLGAPRRLDDAPAGADARAPAALRSGSDLLIAWQDTRDGVERARLRRVPLAALSSPPLERP